MQSGLFAEAVRPEGRLVPCLQDLFVDLGRCGACPSISELERLMRANPVTLDALRAVLRFERAGYTRTRLFESEFCEVLLLAWLPGQVSRIHNHGDSWGAVRVVEGEVVETQFNETADGTVRACGTLRMPAGTIAAEQPRDIHRLANASRVAPLVTLHMYAPPLREMQTYAEPEVPRRNAASIAMK